MVYVLVPIVGITITQAPWVDTQKRVLTEKQGASGRWAKRQLHAFVRFAIAHRTVSRPPFGVYTFGNTMCRRCRRQYVRDEGFIPAPYRQVHRPFLIRRPMPIEYILPAAPV